MQGFLLTLAALAVLVAVTVLATLGFAVRAVRRRNRVSPKVPTAAPVSWLWSPRMGARLHRHLARTVGAARACLAAQAGGLSFADLVADLETHACAIDGQLVLADRAPQPGRSRLLRELQAEVAQVDALTERIIRMSRAWSGAAPSGSGLASVNERIDALEAALVDLDRIDRLPESPDRRLSAG
ncbi:MAG: hypothetical protein ACR2MO_15950 [Acidimicrobiales bacterium]